MRRLLGGGGLDGDGIEVVGLSDVGVGTVEPTETGSTFEANARIKALSYAEQTGAWCLADDSGLVVDALGGRPGVISAHYAWGADEAAASAFSRSERDARNIEVLLGELEGVAAEERTARFVCTMVLAGPGPSGGQGIAAVTTGRFEGRIGVPPSVPRGENGFGYDPVFLAGPDFVRTSAELTPEEKNAVSHRGQAVRAMVERIRSGGWALGA